MIRKASFFQPVVLFDTLRYQEKMNEAATYRPDVAFTHSRYDTVSSLLGFSGHDLDAISVRYTKDPLIS